MKQAHFMDANTDELPPNLRTAAFMKAWSEWEYYRRVEKRNKLTPTTIRLQLRKLTELGEPCAIATLELSMSNGWLGLFPDKTLPVRRSEPSAQPPLKVRRL